MQLLRCSAIGVLTSYNINMPFNFRQTRLTTLTNALLILNLCILTGFGFSSKVQKNTRLPLIISGTGERESILPTSSHNNKLTAPI